MLKFNAYSILNNLMVYFANSDAENRSLCNCSFYLPLKIVITEPCFLFLGAKSHYKSHYKSPSI
jgi:hypothetical protein